MRVLVLQGYVNAYAGVTVPNEASERFHREMGFAPLGVYLNFWHAKLETGSKHTFQVMLVNDEPEDESGNLSIVLEDERGKVLAQKSRPFEVKALGQMTYAVDFDVPKASGKCILKAETEPLSWRFREKTVSRRWVELAKASAERAGK